VLTLDRDGYFSGKAWRDVGEAYQALTKMAERFRKRVQRWMEKQGMTPFGSEYVAVVEGHLSGWPHVNLMIRSPELATVLENERLERELAGLSKRECILLGGALLAAATGTGWGVQSTAERVRDKNAIAGYITKLAGLAGAAASEIAKITQAPLSAPERFHRLRAGDGFLPKRNKSHEVTGTLVRRTRDVDGTPLALPVHNVPARHREQVAACCYHEEELMLGELRVAGG